MGDACDRRIYALVRRLFSFASNQKRAHERNRAYAGGLACHAFVAHTLRHAANQAFELFAEISGRHLRHCCTGRAHASILALLASRPIVHCVSCCVHRV